LNELLPEERLGVLLRLNELLPEERLGVLKLLLGAVVAGELPRDTSLPVTLDPWLRVLGTDTPEPLRVLGEKVLLRPAPTPLLLRLGVAVEGDELSPTVERRVLLSRVPVVERWSF
jgi:hypothetical protein